MTKAFVYLRQSLDKTGTGAAVARQREDCIKLCEDRGWTDVRVFEENDTSASSRKPRPVYTEMLAAIEKGDAQILVAWHVDRLTRKLTDLEHLIELTQQTGLRIVTVTGDIDLSNDAGRLVGRILASVARGEVERKGARQKRAQQQAASQGRPAGGRRAFGYTSDGMNVVEDEAQLVKAAYGDFLAGASLKGIAKKWNDLGVSTTAGGSWRHDNVRTVLMNPRYAGLRAYRGEVVGPAVWPALVDEETHAAAVAILSMPERRTSTELTARKYLLPGLALCWKCGSDVATGHTSYKKRIYVCRASKCVARAAEPIDDLVERVMIARLSRPDALELLSEPSAPDLDLHRSQAAAIMERLDNLATGLEEGILTLASVRRSSERLKSELAQVEAKIQSAVHADVLTPIITASDVEAAWNRCDLAQKRAVIEVLMKVTVLAAVKGRREFDPETVAIEWRVGA